MDSNLSELRIQTVCLLILAAIAVAGALYWLRPVMIPLVLAVFFSLGLSNVSDLMVRKIKAPRPLAMVMTLGLAVLLFFLLVTLVSGSVRQLANKADVYEESIEKTAQDLIDSLNLERFGFRSTSDLEAILDNSAGTIRNMILNTTNNILALVRQSTLVLIFIFFLLIGKPTPPENRTAIWTEIESRVKRYIITKTAVSATTGLIVGVFLKLLGVELAMVFGIFAFLLNFIPSVGSIIATLLPLPVVLISPDFNATIFLLVLLLPGGTQIVIGNIIEPKIMGDNLQLHPVVILAALIFWGMLWGIVGMFLAVPMTAILSILLARTELTRPVAMVLAGNFKDFEEGTKDKT